MTLKTRAARFEWENKFAVMDFKVDADCFQWDGWMYWKELPAVVLYGLL